MKRREFLGTVAAGMAGLLGHKAKAEPVTTKLYCAPGRGVVWFSFPPGERSQVGEKNGRKILA